jgi:leader peptidase (prepilin peptidase) / N-methyltransferase
VDDCEDRNHARCGDDCLLRISRDPGADITGAAARCRIANRNAQSPRHHRFDRDFVSSGVLRRHRALLSAAALFHCGICSSCAYRSRKALPASSHNSQLRAISSWCIRLLFLVVAQNDSLLLSRHRVAWLGAHLDGATILFLCDALHDRLRTGFRIAGGSVGSGSIWIDYLQVHGAHTALRCGADLYSCDNHNAHAGHPDLDRDGASDVPAVRKLHLDCMVNGAPQRTINCRIILVDHSGYKFLFNVFAFVLGAAVGSFLNVCIYRWPVDLSINKPRRSFCPACKQPIPWYQNLPLISWILLGGRCANCGAKIAFRYFAVELITALLFLAIWQTFPWQMAIAYWIFASLLIVGTFIDLEHFIIPDRVTIGGIVAGVACSVAVPALMEANLRLAAGVRSLLAAALGYVILLIVLEAGKIAFGRKRIEFDVPTPFTWTKRGDDADLVVGTEESLWSDYFAREKDRLLLECEEARLDHHTYGNVTLDFRYDRVAAEGQVFMLDDMTQISGVARELVIPREAMGRGDLKFLAAIGAFLGWRAVLFSLFAGSLVGSIVGLVTLVVGKRVWSAKLPFGPYLAFGALSWMLFGNLFLHWYAGLLSP